MKTTTTQTTLKTLVMAAAIITSSTLFGADAESMYNKCAACHGKDAQKHALGKSKIIADMSEEEIKNALNGYKEGTYGGPMKGLMIGQTARLSKEDIEALAAYIPSLKK